MKPGEVCRHDCGSSACRTANKERAAIVAWLRERSASDAAATAAIHACADMIESFAHLRPEAANHNQPEKP